MKLTPFRCTQISFAAILLLALILMALNEQQVRLLQFDRDAILSGQLWRLLTANFVHLGWGHFLMNAAGALLVLLFFGRCLSPRAWLISFTVCSVFIALMVIWLNPDILWYVGLSGTLHGLFVVGGLADVRLRPLEGWLFLALVTAKLTWEQVFGALPGSNELAGGPVLTDAHLYGAVGGLLLWPLIKRWAQP